MSEESRVAIVTGAARGIGAATARRLAADGMAVAVVDLDEAATGETVDAITAAGGRALGVGADVADRAQVEAAVERVAAELGAPTVLVNNAGVLRDNLLFKMTDDDWDTVLGVHLRGAFLFSQAAQQHMVDARWGRIVNLSSTSALGNRGQANYAAAKAGMQGFTKTLAIELGQFGVTVNAVAPGFIVTDMTAATAARMKVDFDDLQKHAAAEIPVRRVGRPEDVAHTISFLVSEGAVVRLRPGHLRRRRPEGLTTPTPPSVHRAAVGGRVRRPVARCGRPPGRGRGQRRAGAPEPEQAEHRQHQRDVAVPAAEAGPDRLVREELGVDQAEDADADHPDQLDGAAGQRDPPAGGAAPGQPDRRHDVDQRGHRREQVGHRRLVELRGDLDPARQVAAMAKSR